MMRTCSRCYTVFEERGDSGLCDKCYVEAASASVRPRYAWFLDHLYVWMSVGFALIVALVYFAILGVREYFIWFK